MELGNMYYFVLKPIMPLMPKKRYIYMYIYIYIYIYIYLFHRHARIKIDSGDASLLEKRLTFCDAAMLILSAFSKN